jgi:SAM-dependent methyltransferase
MNRGGGIMRESPDDRSYGKSAHLYDLFDEKPNIEFFLHYASRAGEVLDIGAGTGRIAIPLAERGVRVCCVEPSPAMRREFERKLAGRPELSDRICLVAGDARSFDAGRSLPAAFLSGCFDHFLDDDERLASLVNIGRHLDVNGVLVFDVFLGLMEDAPISPAGQVFVGDREIRRFVGGRVLPDRTKEVVLVFETFEAGEMVERIEERGLVGLTDRSGVQRILAEAGFDVRREWGDYDFTPYREGASLLIVEASRRG